MLFKHLTVVDSILTLTLSSPSLSLCLSKTRLYNVCRRVLTRQYFSKYSIGVSARTIIGFFYLIINKKLKHLLSKSLTSKGIQNRLACCDRITLFIPV
jgi:hypothetical protein